ncbi:Asp-tRNA(Asn)/Glu-tRNA(Gln) amidotransferase subunit GatB [Sediminitomix flava]|nr:Asp-tRNA(Asn)/Glu-tRNA(Gln) amidotransferase subunit GatB [Sediminitomix flava]
MDKSIINKYELVVGLEVHAQLNTASKIFAGDANEFGKSPNTNISVITLGHPGTLPKLNKSAAEKAIKMGLACHSRISEYNIFDRKNYFYPDLPKGFQTTQDKTPICIGGYLDVITKSGKKSRVKLNRIHMEDDAGKSSHLENEPETAVDLNRAGTALIEIVTEPEIHDAEEANAFLTEVRKIVRYLDISDGNMEEGSLRCDANISVRLKGETKLGKKCEVKNMNSMRNVQRAIEHEFIRQIELIEKGIDFNSETRNFDADTGTTSSLRNKETLNDYRYFPEPDLPPFIVTEEKVAEIKASMPSLPYELVEKFTKEYGLPEYDAIVLTDNREIATYAEELFTKTSNVKSASNWLMGPIKSYLNKSDLSIDKLGLEPAKVAELIQLVDDGKVSTSVAQQELFPAFIKKPDSSAEALAQEMNLIQESGDDFIKPIIDEVLAKFPDKVKAYKKGKKGLIGMFMGEVMKLSGGKVEPKKAKQLVQEALEA